MTTLQATETQNTEGFWLSGDYKFKDNETFLQEAGRVADLVKFTVVSRIQSSLKLVPLTDLNPALTSAKMVCGANGGNLAAWQAVGDGEFAINVDGTIRNFTGIVTTAVVALTDLLGILQAACAGVVEVGYDALADVFSFTSLKSGLPASTITVLTAVSGGSGTDISGTGFLNGLTTVGIVTAATGEASTAIPIGIFVGNDIATADLVADDVTDQLVVDYGDHATFDVDKLILENSLDIDDIISGTGKSIRQHLTDIGLIASATDEIFQGNPLT